MDSAIGAPAFDSEMVNLTEADPRDVVCFLNRSENEYDGRLGARISALFVILVTATVLTLFPVVARRVRWLRVPVQAYLFARYFGAGVIIATAFVHLLDPAYAAIGPHTCVGMTGHWADYSWIPAILLSCVLLMFLVDFGAERYVEARYGIHAHEDVQAAVTGQPDARLQPVGGYAEQEAGPTSEVPPSSPEKRLAAQGLVEEGSTMAEERSYRQQIAAFLILEFGVIFHSAIIGLNLGTAGSEFGTLYVVLVFHQSFEGLGIGARMSAIPFPRGSRLPWILCAAYGLTTPIAIAIGLGVRNTYNAGSFTANVVAGLLDAMSAGVLTYTGLVELLARDFLFNPHRTQDHKRLAFMISCVFLGAALMALLGKWA
ncbi:MAG: high-affinity Zn(2+) transporter zrt1 [Thelocarpon impressellum]|nr:MAG: high-affinity Zn(2+) transporter zrt1 [Thelocarpon impressellum]